MKCLSLLILGFFILISPASVLAQEELVNKFELVSPSFRMSSPIPRQYTCQGGDINPPLEFKNLPLLTKSLALTVHDPDAPEGIWVHWVVYNIPPAMTVVAENTNPGSQALNDFGKDAYNGPCPTNEKPHHYVFRAYALNAVVLINEGSTMKDLEKAIKGHVLAKSELIGLYQKPMWK